MSPQDTLTLLWDVNKFPLEIDKIGLVLNRIKNVCVPSTTASSASSALGSSATTGAAVLPLLCFLGLSATQTLQLSEKEDIISFTLQISPAHDSSDALQQITKKWRELGGDLNHKLVLLTGDVVQDEGLQGIRDNGRVWRVTSSGEEGEELLRWADLWDEPAAAEIVPTPGPTPYTSLFPVTAFSFSLPLSSLSLPPNTTTPNYTPPTSTTSPFLSSISSATSSPSSSPFLAHAITPPQQKQSFMVSQALQHHQSLGMKGQAPVPTSRLAQGRGAGRDALRRDWNLPITATAATTDDYEDDDEWLGGGFGLLRGPLPFPGLPTPTVTTATPPPGFPAGLGRMATPPGFPGLGKEWGGGGASMGLELEGGVGREKEDTDSTLRRAAEKEAQFVTLVPYGMENVPKTDESIKQTATVATHEEEASPAQPIEKKEQEEVSSSAMAAIRCAQSSKLGLEASAKSEALELSQGEPCTLSTRGLQGSIVRPPSPAPPKDSGVLPLTLEESSVSPPPPPPIEPEDLPALCKSFLSHQSLRLHPLFSAILRHAPLAPYETSETRLLAHGERTLKIDLRPLLEMAKAEFLVLASTSSAGSDHLAATVRINPLAMHQVSSSLDHAPKISPWSTPGSGASHLFGQGAAGVKVASPRPAAIITGGGSGSSMGGRSPTAARSPSARSPMTPPSSSTRMLVPRLSHPTIPSCASPPLTPSPTLQTHEATGSSSISSSLHHHMHVNNETTFLPLIKLIRSNTTPHPYAPHKHSLIPLAALGQLDPTLAHRHGFFNLKAYCIAGQKAGAVELVAKPDKNGFAHLWAWAKPTGGSGGVQHALQKKARAGGVGATSAGYERGYEQTPYGLVHSLARQKSATAAVIHPFENLVARLEQIERTGGGLPTRLSAIGREAKEWPGRDGLTLYEYVRKAERLGMVRLIGRVDDGPLGKVHVWIGLPHTFMGHGEKTPSVSEGPDVDAEEEEVETVEVYVVDVGVQTDPVVIQSLEKGPDESGRSVEDSKASGLGGGNVIFTWKYPGAQKVLLTGSWDQWEAELALEKHASEWRRGLQLPPGKYFYAFMVDGEMMVDDQLEMNETADELWNVIEVGNGPNSARS